MFDVFPTLRAQFGWAAAFSPTLQAGKGPSAPGLEHGPAGSGAAPLLRCSAGSSSRVSSNRSPNVRESPKRSFPKRAAASMGRRNTGLKFIGWRLEPQRLSRPLIQAKRDLVEIVLRVARQIRSVREVLPQ